METKLFYVVEDDYSASALYPTKNPWLESLRYNLDVAVEEEDFSQEESNEKYQLAKTNASKEAIQTNGFYYSIQEIKIVYQSQKIIVRYYDYNNEVSLYTFNGESYDYEEDFIICKNDSEDDIAETLKRFIKNKDVNITNLSRDIKQIMVGGESND